MSQKQISLESKIWYRNGPYILTLLQARLYFYILTNILSLLFLAPPRIFLICLPWTIFWQWQAQVWRSPASLFSLAEILILSVFLERQHLWLFINLEFSLSCCTLNTVSTVIFLSSIFLLFNNIILLLFSFSSSIPSFDMDYSGLEVSVEGSSLLIIFVNSFWPIFSVFKFLVSSFVVL